MANFIPVEAVEDDKETNSFVPVAEVEDTFTPIEEVPEEPAKVPAFKRLAETLTSNKLLPSATGALNNATDKGLRRKPDGDWDLPIMAPVEGGLTQGFKQTAVSMAQKAGERLDQPNPGFSVDRKAIQKVFHDFQQANNLSDDEVAAAWSDMGNLNRKWDKAEPARILSDGTLIPNSLNSDWLDPAKAASMIDASAASPASKAATLANLPKIQEAIAERKAEAFQAAFEAGAFGKTSFKDFSAAKGDMPLVDQVKAYEAEHVTNRGAIKKQLDEWTAAEAAGTNKVFQTIYGLTGAVAGDTAVGRAAGELAAETSRETAALKEGADVEGLISSGIEEIPSLAIQIALTRGVGAGATALGVGAEGAKLASTLAAFTTAGGQSAGVTYADEIAAGATPEAARAKALKTGITTALVTAAFGTGAGGGVESVAVGKSLADTTVRDLASAFAAKGTGEITRSKALRDFAGGVLKAAGGEASEEGIDQLLGTFASADPNTTIGDAWGEALEAAKVGGFIGGAVHTAAGALEGKRPDPVEEVAGELISGAAAGMPESDAVAAANEPLDADEERLPPPEEARPPEVPEVQAEASGSPPPEVAPGPLEVPAATEGLAGEPVTPLTDENEDPQTTGEGSGPLGEAPSRDEGIPEFQDSLQRDVPPSDPNAYSKENLAAAFDLTPEQAEATDTLVQAMGLDTSRIQLKRGGTPGQGALGQDTPARLSAALPDADKRAAAAELGFDSWTPEAAQAFTQRISDWLVTGKPDALEPVFRKVLDSDKNLFQKPGAQGIKGSFETLADTGKVLLRGLTNPDVSTGIHELAHVARTTLFDRAAPVAGVTPEDITVAEDWAGAKDGKWDVKAEEKFARGFEKYLRDGEAPVPELESVFAKIADWFRNIYQSLKGTPLDLTISPEMRAVFDALVTRGTLPEGTTGAPAVAVPKPVQTEPPSSEVSKTPEEMGTTGAPAPEPDTTSTKNAATDAELERMGFDPIAAPARKALGTSWDEAQAAVEADPDAGAKLVADILDKPRALKDDVENGVLLIELAKKKAAFGKAQKDYVAAVESGNKVEADRTKSALDAARGEVAQVIDAAKLTGTAWGRSGRFRQLAIDEDYSLVALENKYRTEVNDGKPLTETQIKEVQALHDRIVAVEKKLEEAEKKIARKTFEEEQAARKKAKPKIRKALAPKLDAARKRLQEQGFLPQDAPPAAEGDFLAQEDLPPQTLEDLGTIGASWLVDKDLDLRVFTNRLKRMFGDKAAPHAEAIFAKAKEIVGTAADAVVAETTDETAPRKKKSKEEILEGIDPDKDITGRDVFQLARAHVNAGVEGFENVMAAVLADLQSTHPDLTMREVHDAYSGYGKIIRPNPAEDLKALREYQQLARLTSQLEDAEKKLAPMRTGLQRDKATEKVRVLQKKVKEAMRKMGIKAAGSKDLSTALDAVKNRLRNEFEELDAAVKAQTPLPEKGDPVAYDKEAKDLKAKRDAKKAEYDALFPKAGETVDEAIEKAEKSLDKSIRTEEDLIRKSMGKRPVQAKDRVAWSQGIADRRARLKELTKQRQDLRDKNAERLARNKKLVQSRTEKILQRLAEKNYEPKAKPDPLTPDKELEALQLEEFRAKRAINEKIVEARRANRTRLERYRDNALDIAMVLGRAVNTAIDLGHFGRQGGLVNFARPEITMRHLKDLVTFSEKGADTAQMKLEGTTPEEKAMFKRAKDSGLGLTEWRPGHKLNDMEEAFKSHLAKKIPGIAASERAYVTYMNAIRFDYFNTLAKALPNPTKDNLKELANHVNNLTGRGSLDIKPLKINLENSASNLALLLFSPKYWSSRLRVAANILAVPVESTARAIGLDFRKKEIQDARRVIAKEYARLGAGGATFYGLIGIAAMMAKALAGDDDEPLFKLGVDPRSSDFGKMVFRNGSRVDTMAGMSQNLVFLSRMLKGETANPEGDVVDLDDMEDSQHSRGVVAEKFFRSKLAPLPGAIASLALKRDTGYNKAFWEKELLGLYAPISVTETINGYNELGWAGGTAGAISGFFGEGVNTYGEGVEDADIRESILSSLHDWTGGKLGRSQEEYDDK